MAWVVARTHDWRDRSSRRMNVSDSDLREERLIQYLLMMSLT